MFIRFDRIHERDRQPDRQTDGRTDIARQHYSSVYAKHRAVKMNENSACVCVRLSDGESLVETSQDLRQ